MVKSAIRSSGSLPIHLIRQAEWKAFSARQPKSSIAWAKANHFKAEPGSFCIIPDQNGDIAQIWAAIPDAPNIWSIAYLPDQLPEGRYHLRHSFPAPQIEAMELGWQLACYRFSRYKKCKDQVPVLNMTSKNASTFATALTRARDLINTPANDMGPKELAQACRQVAETYHAQYDEIIGEDLLAKNYPSVYEVGKASARAPRLIDIRWGNPSLPKVSLVGKGVCFDSGGLDIKTSSGMKMMKKDMGGAACVLALAELIMAHKLPVRLRVLIPAVENSISGNAYRPMDVINTRKGITVEVGNTDAEGRLILADALFEADQEKPDLLIDCATLTGAARTALGTDIPGMFTSDDTLASDLARLSADLQDPLWRLPLWQGYRDMLKSQVADINSAPDSGYAGAITAALYLNEFVTFAASWVHIDMMAWNLSSRPGRPQGGEAMAVRSLFALMEERFAPKQKKIKQNTGSQRKK